MAPTMNIAIKKLEEHATGFFDDLLRVVEAVFEMKDFQMPSRAHVKRLLRQDSFWGFVALADDRVIGGLTAYILPQ